MATGEAIPLRTHHEQRQNQVTHLLQHRWAQDQQQPSQQFQPAHSHLVAHGIWLVAEHLQRKHLSELHEQGFLGVAGQIPEPHEAQLDRPQNRALEITVFPQVLFKFLSPVIQ